MTDANRLIMRTTRSGPVLDRCDYLIKLTENSTPHMCYHQSVTVVWTRGRGQTFFLRLIMHSTSISALWIEQHITLFAG